MEKPKMQRLLLPLCLALSLILSFQHSPVLAETIGDSRDAGGSTNTAESLDNTEGWALPGGNAGWEKLTGDFNVTYQFTIDQVGDKNWDNFIIEMKAGTYDYLKIRADAFAFTNGPSFGETFGDNPTSVLIAEWEGAPADWAEWRASCVGATVKANLVRRDDTFLYTAEFSFGTKMRAIFSFGAVDVPDEVDLTLLGEKAAFSGIKFINNQWTRISGMKSNTQLGIKTEEVPLSGDFDITYKCHEVGGEFAKAPMLEFRDMAGNFIDIRSDNWGWLHVASSDETIEFSDWEIEVQDAAIKKEILCWPGAEWDGIAAERAKGMDFEANVKRVGSFFTAVITESNSDGPYVIWKYTIDWATMGRGLTSVLSIGNSAENPETVALSNIQFFKNNSTTGSSTGGNNTGGSTGGNNTGGSAGGNNTGGSTGGNNTGGSTGGNSTGGNTGTNIGGNGGKETVKLAAPKLTVKLSSANAVKLSWGKISKAAGYYIFRATSKNGNYKKIKTVKTLTYTDKKLKSGKTYYYKVQAYNGRSVGSQSKEASRKIIGKPATPLQKNLAAKSGYRFTISWNTAKNAEYIEIWIKRPGKKKFSKWKTVAAKKKKATYSYYSFSGGRYSFRLRAFYKKDGMKVSSGDSNERSFIRRS